MKKFILFLILSLFSIVPAYSYQISFPGAKNLSIQSDGIFFAGCVNKNEDVFINGEKIVPNANGAFSKSYKLNLGDNTFSIKSSEDKKTPEDTYIIKRLPIDNLNTNLVEFPPQSYKTTKDNVVLRSTPIDFGMNRMGYLPQGTDLIINGTKNEFSRVFLSPTNEGWVFTKDTIPDIRPPQVMGEFIGEGVSCEDNEYINNYKFSKNLPYSTKLDNNTLTLEVYNVENQNNQTFSTQIDVPNPQRYGISMDNGVLVVTVEEAVLEKQKFCVIVDAGHGGHEPGASGCLGDFEKDINIGIAKQLEKSLKSNCVPTILTRDSDKDVGLDERVNSAKNGGAVLFVSIHLNSVPENVNPNNFSGTTTYYYNEQAKSFACNVQKSLVNGLCTKDNGVKQASFAVIRPTEYIGILVEVAYMVNPSDVELYKSKDFYKKTADGIANGILDYINCLTVPNTP